MINDDDIKIPTINPRFFLVASAFEIIEKLGKDISFYSLSRPNAQFNRLSAIASDCYLVRIHEASFMVPSESMDYCNIVAYAAKEFDRTEDLSLATRRMLAYAQVAEDIRRYAGFNPWPGREKWMARGKEFVEERFREHAAEEAASKRKTKYSFTPFKP